MQPFHAEDWPTRTLPSLWDEVSSAMWERWGPAAEEQDATRWWHVEGWRIEVTMAEDLIRVNIFPPQAGSGAMTPELAWVLQVTEAALDGDYHFVRRGDRCP